MYITDADLSVPENLAVIHGLIDQMEELISSHSDPLPEHIQIYLEPWHSGGPDCGYFMVDADPGKRCIFWLHTFGVAKLERLGLTSSEELREETF